MNALKQQDRCQILAKDREIECRVLDGTEIENVTGKSVFNWREPICRLKNLNLGLFDDLSLSGYGIDLELNLGIFKQDAHFTYAKYFYARKLSAKLFINKLLWDFAYIFFLHSTSQQPLYFIALK
ncbi:hypothetical protein [Acinetobacter bohemicus]|uniref:hypothetical protein n=1 Tax=Acinetobacter bohemicus TaxID=1435036 RepID=UPI003FA283AA